MHQSVYKIIELAGTSSHSIEEAINRAIQEAAKTLKHLDWFEVVQTRGYLEDAEIKQYQVVLKVGFRIEK